MKLKLKLCYDLQSVGQRERDHWEDQGVDGVDVRMHLGEVGCGDVDWIGLAKDRNRWRVLVNSVLNLRVP
jgi:hypothetical protein